MPASALDIIGPAFERMTRQLFRPFRFGQWARLAFVGFLAGELSGGCSPRLGFNFPFPSPAEGFPPGPGGPLAVLGIGILIFLGLILGILFLYLSSRMRFVLFDSVVSGECRIGDSWRQRGTPGFRYFIFQLLLLVFFVLTVGVLIGVAFLLAAAMGVLQDPRQHVLALILGGSVTALLLFIWLVVLFLVHVLTKDFVVPQMALESTTVGEGWSRLWAMMKSEKGGYLGYLGMKLVLAIAASIVLGIISFTVILLILLPVGGLGALTVLAGRAAGFGWNPLTIAIAIVVGGVIVLALLAISALISVPSIVFFPAYAIHFFADRYPPLHTLLFPPPAPPVSTPSPQP